MKYKPKFAIVSGISAIVIGGACCWLPALIIFLGGSSAALAISNVMSGFTIPLFILGGLSLIIGFWLYFKNKQAVKDEIILESQITCPICDFQKVEIMPENSCQFFYECKRCNEVLKPKAGDCCVYCSYGSEKCPPVQKNEKCC